MHVDCSERSLKCNVSFDWSAECSVGEELACMQTAVGEA